MEPDPVLSSTEPDLSSAYNKILKDLKEKIPTVEVVEPAVTHQMLGNLLAGMPTSIQYQVDLIKEYTVQSYDQLQYMLDGDGSERKLPIEILYDLISECAKDAGGMTYLRQVLQYLTKPFGNPAAVLVAKVFHDNGGSEPTYRWSMGTTLTGNKAAVKEIHTKRRQRFSELVGDRNLQLPSRVIEIWANPQILMDTIEQDSHSLHKSTGDRHNAHGSCAEYTPLVRVLLSSTPVAKVEAWAFRKDKLLPPCLSDMVRYHILSLYMDIETIIHYETQADRDHAVLLSADIVQLFGTLPDDARPNQLGNVPQFLVGI